MIIWDHLWSKWQGNQKRVRVCLFLCLLPCRSSWNCDGDGHVNGGISVSARSVCGTARGSKIISDNTCWFKLAKNILALILQKVITRGLWWPLICSPEYFGRGSAANIRSNITFCNDLIFYTNKTRGTGNFEPAACEVISFEETCLQKFILNYGCHFVQHSWTIWANDFYIFFFFKLLCGKCAIGWNIWTLEMVNIRKIHFF